MKRILVPVDFSTHTVNTCRYAIEIAKQYASEIILFHAYYDQVYISSPSLPDAYDINPYTNTEGTEDAKKLAQLHIDNLASELIGILKNENINNVSISTYIAGGNFEYDLNQYCEEYHPSVIIIGARGKGNSLSIFGVNATHLINNVKWPVMAVPDAAVYNGINNVMFASSLEPSEDILIRKLLNKFDAFDINVYCIYISENSNYLSAEVRFDELKEIFAKENQAGKFNCDFIEGNDHHHEIQNFINKNNIDLIAYLPHKTSFFQRLFGKKVSSDKELFNTNLPLLSMRN